MNIKHGLHELLKDIRYFLDIEKVDVDSLPGMNPVAPERAKEIQEEMSKHNNVPSRASRMRIDRR